MLDFSLTFDTIDQGYYLVFIDGSPPSWILSYPTKRSNRVYINDEFSDATSMRYAMPQGSAVGPWLFTKYILPVNKNKATKDIFAVWRGEHVTTFMEDLL